MPLASGDVVYEKLQGGRLEVKVTTTPSSRVTKPTRSRRRQWPTTTWTFSALLRKQLAEAELDLLREMVKSFAEALLGA